MTETHAAVRSSRLKGGGMSGWVFVGYRYQGYEFVMCREGAGDLSRGIVGRSWPSRRTEKRGGEQQDSKLGGAVEAR